MEETSQKFSPVKFNMSMFPILSWADSEITIAEQARINRIANRLLDEEPAFHSDKVFGDNVNCGLTNKPKLLIGDLSEIPLLGDAEDSIFGYRIGLLAGDGDILVLAQKRNFAFEDYLKKLLGLSKLDAVEVTTPFKRDRKSLPERCLKSRKHFEYILNITRQSGGLCIVPHIATGHVWRLGYELARQSKSAISICGPSPRLSLRANDKLWFAARVREILGPRSIPPSFSAYGPAALTGQIGHLVKRYDKVVIKIPNSAGSAGNLTLDSKSLSGLTVPELRAQLIALLKTLGWRNRYPLLVEVWDTNVISSPSVQYWIPLRCEGLPIIEGVFEQIVEGEAGNFVGAIRAQRSADWLEPLINESIKIAFLLQQMGYFGRCSFDSVVIDDEINKIHWIECNARWGGVSLPMTLANRVIADPSESEYVILQHEGSFIAPHKFEDILKIFDKRFFWPNEKHEGIIFLTPTGIERGRGLHLMAIARSTARAKELALKTSSELLQ